ncbi:CACNA1H, partial [Symbiodinium pilosum]
ELLTLVNGMRAASRAVTSALMLIIGLNYVFAIIINMFLSEVTNDQNETVWAKFHTLGLSMWSLALHGIILRN